MLTLAAWPSATAADQTCREPLRCGRRLDRHAPPRLLAARRPDRARALVTGWTVCPNHRPLSLRGKVARDIPHRTRHCVAPRPHTTQRSLATILSGQVVSALSFVNACATPAMYARCCSASAARVACTSSGPLSDSGGFELSADGVRPQQHSRCSVASRRARFTPLARHAASFPSDAALLRVSACCKRTTIAYARAHRIRYPARPRRRHGSAGARQTHCRP